MGWKKKEQKERAAGENRSTWSVWGQKQVNSKITSKVYPTSPAVGSKRNVPVFGRIKPRYTRRCLTLIDFQLFFVIF